MEGEKELLFVYCSFIFNGHTKSFTKRTCEHNENPHWRIRSAGKRNAGIAERVASVKQAT